MKRTFAAAALLASAGYIGGGCSTPGHVTGSCSTSGSRTAVSIDNGTSHRIKVVSVVLGIDGVHITSLTITPPLVVGPGKTGTWYTEKFLSCTFDSGSYKVMRL